MTDTPVSPEEIAWGVRRLFEAIAAQRPARRGLRRHPLGRADVPRSHRVRRVVRAGRPDLRPVHRATRPLRRAADLDGAEAQRDPLTLEHCPRTTARRSWSGSATFRNGARERIVAGGRGEPALRRAARRDAGRERDDELEVPPTLQALLAARIDRLGRAGARGRSSAARSRDGSSIAAPSPHSCPSPSEARSARTCCRSSARS